MAGAKGSALDANALRPVHEAIGGPVALQESERSGYKDGLFAERWIAEQCGIGDLRAILPEAWAKANP
jgi:hypothetical protein